MVLLEISWAMPATLIGAGRAAEGLGGVAVAVESSGSAWELPEQRCAESGRVAVEREVVGRALPDGAPLRMVVVMLIQTCWLTPRLPLPAFQRQRSRVRPVPAKFGICSKTWGAGRPVPWSSKVQLEKTQVDRQQVGGDQVLQAAPDRSTARRCARAGARRRSGRG